MKAPILYAAALGAAMFTFGCATAPQNPDERMVLHDDVNSQVQRMSLDDPSLKPFLNQARAYAIFPTIGKGGAGLGGAYGRGEVYDRGHFIGYTDVAQGTLGPQLGGQSYSEILVFETDDSLEHFKEGKLAFDANASGVALKSGAAASSAPNNGVVTFVDPKEGLMFEAAIGGQNFSFEPSDANLSAPQTIAGAD